MVVFRAIVRGNNRIVIPHSVAVELGMVEGDAVEMDVKKLDKLPE